MQAALTRPAVHVSNSPWTRDVIVAIVALYSAAFVIVLTQVGLWTATRQVFGDGLIVCLWLWVAHMLLGGAASEQTTIRKPRLELLLGLVGLMVMGLIVSAFYLHWFQSGGVGWLVEYLLPIGVLFALRYDRRALGWQNASRRAWLAVLLIILTNVIVGVGLGRLLPSSEFAGQAGIDVSQGINGPLDVIAAIAQLLIVAAIPEELYFRIFMQPRLGRYMPIGWAILAQALLFSALHLPQQLFALGNPLPLALAFTVLTPANGLVGGYLRWRTQSLPLLAVLHLFAYPRFGL